MGAKEGRSCKGATCQRQEDHPEKRSYQKGAGKSTSIKGGQEAGHGYCTGCGATCRLRGSDGVGSLSSFLPLVLDRFNEFSRFLMRILIEFR